MILFNIIYPARYLAADPVVPMVNSSAKNHLEMNGMPVVGTDIAKPVEPIQNV
jgi:hypothetical protein